MSCEAIYIHASYYEFSKTERADTTGVTGLAAVKNLVEQGFEVEALERSQHIGGLWRYNEDKNLLSVLKSE